MKNSIFFTINIYWHHSPAQNLKLFILFFVNKKKGLFFGRGELHFMVDVSIRVARVGGTKQRYCINCNFGQ